MAFCITFGIYYNPFLYLIGTNTLQEPMVRQLEGGGRFLVYRSTDVVQISTRTSRAMKASLCNATTAVIIQATV
jgi:hypothetical protein